jgi:hypothetical protein
LRWAFSASFICALTCSKIGIASPVSRIRTQSATRALGSLALLVGLAACAWLPGGGSGTRAFRAPEIRYGDERYSAWFADERGGVLYFGLSPFWTELWATGDPAADLRTPGAQLIGRFDLASESFLPPLVARAEGPDSRSSVWDVLAHPNGWIYFTTFYEEMGRVRPDTGEVERFPALGRGLNELALGPEGQVYATRYGSGLDDPHAKQDGALLAVSENGRKLGELRLHARDGAVTAAKSVAVDPRSGRIFVNADLIHGDGNVEFARFVIDPDLSILDTEVGGPELLFIAFASDGRAVSVWDDGGRLRLALGDGERERASIDLGPRVPGDFAQDIHFAADGSAAVAFWSGRVDLVRARAGGFEHASLTLEKPPDCVPPAGRSLVYSAFAGPRAVHATLYCGVTILRGALPDQWQPIPAREAR